MLYTIMQECKNLFPHKYVSGHIEIVDGVISLHDLRPGQYYIIDGSIFNDGLHQFGAETLVDEDFDGHVVYCAIPQAFLDLAKEIEEWNKANTGGVGMASESFAGYSYTRASGADGGAFTWRDAFRDELRHWRLL